MAPRHRRLVFFSFPGKSFSQTYGPLAGMVGLLLWSLFSAVAVLRMAPPSPRNSKRRAPAPAPQDAEKVELRGRE
jgi:hypothetical protein